MKNLFFILIIFLFGCASPTPFQKANRWGRGYTDQKLDNNKYRISFKGNRLTERETVEAYLLYRAAEICLKDGFSFFTFTSFNTDRMTQLEGISPVLYQNPVAYDFRVPFYLYNSPNLGTRGGTLERTEFEAVAFLAMAKTAPEAKKELYFNASEILQNLKSKIVRPD